MKNTLLILLLGIVSLLHSASAQVLTNGQVYPWNPGVRGGIPYYPNSITVTGAVGNGIADDYQAITNAMRRTTNGGAVYLPAGTYRVNTEINFTYPTSIVIRGAGPSLTKIISYATGGGAGAINFGLDTSRTTAAYATNGYTYMSSNLTLTSVSGIATGQMARLLQTNDPAAIFGYSSQQFEQGELFIVTNISGNTITFDRPLSYTYGASFGPFVESFTKSTRYCGLEDLTVEMGTTNTTKFNPVYFRIANNCWLTNCVITNGVEDNVMISQCARISVVGSRLENHHTYTSASRYGVLLGEWTSDCLIEDNIIQGNNVAVIVQYGASGNVIGYNFSDRGFVHDGYGGVYPAPTDNSGGFFAGHGFNPRMNLFEGNVANGFGVDDTWGQNNHNTFFRNWATRFSYYNPTNFSLVANQGIFGIVNDATNWFQNYVGNIVGSPRDSNSVSTADIYIGVSRQHGNTFDGGYASNTCVFVGNFSWRTNGTYWPSGAPVTLTNSYYRTVKPSWFGRLSWPPIGPDVNTTATITNSAVIPAQARFLGQGYTTVFVTNNASGARVMGFRGLGMSVLPPLASPYLLEQGFEGTSYDNSQTWAEVGSATLNEDYTSTVLVGSQSMLIDLTSNTGDTTSPLISMPSGGGNIWYVYFQLRVLTFPSSGFRVATVTNSFDLSINASSNLVIRPQVGTGVATVGKLEAGTTYHVWMQGSGNDIETAGAGTARVGFSTTGIRPTSGDNYAIDTDVSANSPFTTVQLVLGSRQVSANYSVIIDKVRVDNDVIGDNPQ